MRITYIHQHFRTPGDSTATRSYEMARRMAEAGHRVTVVAGHERRQGDERVQTPGPGEFTVRWVRTVYRSEMRFWRRVVSFAVFAVAAGRAALGAPADVVLASSTPLTVALPGVLSSRRWRCPFVFEVRDLWPELPIAVGALRHPVLQRLAWAFARWSYRNASAVVALSPGMAVGVRRVHREAAVTVIPNSADASELAASPESVAAFRRSLAWAENAPAVVYAGSVNRLNEVEYLARVAAAARSSYPECRFLVVGEGAEWSRVAAVAEQLGVLDRNFFMHPAVPRRDVGRVLHAADVAVSLFASVPEMEHNSANKFFDGLAAGRAVAVNYGGWQADILERTGAGLRLDRDPARAAEQLGGLLIDTDRLIRAKAAAATLAHARFSRQEAFDNLMTVLRSVTKEPS